MGVIWSGFQRVHEKNMVGNVFAIYQKSNIQNFFNSSIFPLPCIVILEIGNSFSMRIPVQTKFILYTCIVSMKILLTLKTGSTKRQPLSKNWCNFTAIRSREVGKMPIQNAGSRPEKNLEQHCKNKAIKWSLTKIKRCFV